MKNIEIQKVLKAELEVPNEDIVRIRELLYKLAIIEYENYKQAA